MTRVAAVRHFLTGTDADGRSCLIATADFAFTEGAPGIGTQTLFETHENPLPPRPPCRGTFLDLAVSPGLARWMVLEYAPGASFPTHYTDTVDLDIVLAGSLELTLDDGVHHLAVGDCVVMGGVDHAWQAGPEGCTLSVVALGTPPPS
jgi:quercetin dioxygenase-like cupin family protein